MSLNLLIPLPASCDAESPRKRPRMCLNDENLENPPMLVSPMVAPVGTTDSRRAVRDEDYYLSDGSCIIRIEDTLFNVHRFLLSRDSSSFSTLFTLPQGNQLAEGLSDDHPIVLKGDSVGEFRNFLWAMYALPHELKLLFDTQEDVDKLHDIAKIANKYNFKSIESWACDALLECIARGPPQPIEADGEAAHRVLLTRTVHLAQLCGHAHLLRTTVGFVRQLMGTSPAYLALALSLADELEIDELTGAAYFAMLLKGADYWASEASLTAPQRLRLLNGYFNLTNEWERRRTTPFAFVHSQACGVTWHQGQCATSWQEFWKKQMTSEGVMRRGLADVSGRLRVIVKEVDRWGPWGQATLMHHECRLEVKKGLLSEIKALEDNLTSYFPPL